MFFWRRVAPQSPEEGLKPTATPGYTRNFRDLNRMVSQGKSFSGYERNPLFLNLGGKGFAEVGALLAADYDDDARAVAVVDWDHDGDLDIWLTNRTAPRVRLLRNNHPPDNASVAIRLIGNGTTTNCDAIGARLTLWSSSDPKLTQIRTVHAGDGFLSQSSSWNHFGLGPASEDSHLRVAWPGGATETFSGLRSGLRYTITQAEGQSHVVAEASSPALPIVEKPEPELEAADTPLPRSGFWVANRLPFPKLTYVDRESVRRSTTDFMGRPVLVNLWGTWCAPCLEELAVFGKHADALNTQGATVLALNVDGLAVEGSATPGGNPEDVLAHVNYSLPRGIARQEDLAKIEVLLEFLSSRRAPLSIPSSFLVDAKGDVAAVYLEPLTWNQLAEDLAILESPPEAQLARMSPRPGRWSADPRRIDRSAYLGDYAASFGLNGMHEESQRLYETMQSQDEVLSAHDYYNQAKAAAQQGSTEEAVEYYRAALRLDPEYGQALTGLGALLLMDKRLDEAQPLFEKALSIDPDHAAALVNLAMIDQARGEHDRARARLERVVARNPDYAEAHLNLGVLLASMKKHDEAIRHFSRAVDLNPKTEVARLNLAAAYVETQQWDKAEEQYRHVQSLNPRMAYPHYGLGVLQARRGLHAEAVAAYRKAISLGGVNAATYTQLGLSLVALDQTQAAGEAFRAALKLDPRHAGAKRALQENGLLFE